MDGSRPKRSSMKLSEVQFGVNSIKTRFESVASRGNRVMRKDLPVVKSGTGEKECNAYVYEGDDEATATGEYNSVACTHAEINALAAYIAEETNFQTISKIEITAPPCKCCAFVLELLGVLNKVRTTGDIYKNPTGSWVWHNALKDPRTFDGTEWNTIKTYFARANMTDDQILQTVVTTIQTAF